MLNQVILLGKIVGIHENVDGTTGLEVAIGRNGTSDVDNITTIMTDEMTKAASVMLIPGSFVAIKAYLITKDGVLSAHALRIAAVQSPYLEEDKVMQS